MGRREEGKIREAAKGTKGTRDEREKRAKTSQEMGWADREMEVAAVSFALSLSLSSATFFLGDKFLRPDIIFHSIKSASQIREDSLSVKQAGRNDGQKQRLVLFNDLYVCR